MIKYCGYDVYKCGGWTQGLCLLQALQILEGFDLRSMGLGDVRRIHLPVEALKLALADRDTYHTDPLFQDVPVQKLLERAYASERRTLVRQDRASLVRQPGDVRAGKAALDPQRDPAEHHQVARSAVVRDTTTCATVDR
jgi:gamma-glutamyltranspeptidase/glutathione hydrolase